MPAYPLRFAAIAILWASGIFLICTAAMGQDTIVYQTAPAKPSQTRQGTILDYNAKVLTIKIGDNQRRIPSSQIQSISTAYTTSHVRGNEQWNKKNYIEAIKFFRDALDQEPRDWVQREIKSQLVQAMRENGNWLESAKIFTELLAFEPQCRFFDVIPVAWTPMNPNAGRTTTAEKWMEGSDEIRTLIGSSYLMSTVKREQALKKLQKLKQSKDGRVARIATMQIWRSRMLVASESEVKAWKQKLEKFPESIRSGGYFVIAGAYANNPKLASVSRDRAAIELMRVPILFPTKHRLSASALHSAAKLIQTSNPSGSRKILKELASKFPKTEFGKSAAAQLSKR